MKATTHIQHTSSNSPLTLTSTPLSLGLVVALFRVNISDLVLYPSHAVRTLSFSKAIDCDSHRTEHEAESNGTIPFQSAWKHKIQSRWATNRKDTVEITSIFQPPVGKSLVSSSYKARTSL